MNLPEADARDIFAIRSQHYAFEYGYRKPHWELTSSLYYKKTDYQNIVNPIIGAEFFAAWTYARFKGSFSAAHIHSMLKAGEQTIPSSYDFDYFLRFIAKYDIPNWFEVSLVYLYRQGQAFEPLSGKIFHYPSTTWQPQFAAPSQGVRLPTYQLLDLSISKIVPLGEGSLVLFLSANNLLNIKNVRGYSYDYEYVERMEDLYNQRVVFMGGSWSF